MTVTFFSQPSPGRQLGFGCMKSRAEIRPDMDRIPIYPYPYLLYLMNTKKDIDIIRMQKFIFIFILNAYRYNSNTERMDILIDISRIIKFYDYKIKDITK